MMAIATAVASKATEALSDPALHAVAAISRRIREKFLGQPAELQVLEEAPTDPAKVEELAILLDERSAEDPEFGRSIRELWSQGGLIAADEGVMNVFHGNANKVIQLRDVHGDLNISLRQLQRNSTDRSHVGCRAAPAAGGLDDHLVPGTSADPIPGNA